jgi:branched-chain amino acid transport system ATP-binding protein
VNALTIIRREHRDLGMTLLCFESALRSVEDKKQEPDAVLFHAMISYLDSYLNRFHHPKENEHLFPALRMRYPASEELIQTLKNDHEHGDRHCRRLGDALTRYQSSETAFDDFHHAALNYIDRERRHIKLEETELLPLVDAHLSDSDWEPIDVAFSSNDDPMFGDQRQQQYRNLSNLINNVCIYGDPLL